MDKQEMIEKATGMLARAIERNNNPVASSHNAVPLPELRPILEMLEQGLEAGDE